jgi:hypothetical protein
MSEKPAKKETKSPRYELLGKKATVDRKLKALTLLRESLFNVAWVCKQVDIQRRSFLRWRTLDPEFERACTDTQEEIYDEAEVYLQKKIREGDTASLIFFLKTKVKSRGYVETRNIEHSGVMTKKIDLSKIMEECKNGNESTDPNSPPK